jgi:hypothetical protein
MTLSAARRLSTSVRLSGAVFDRIGVSHVPAVWGDWCWCRMAVGRHPFIGGVEGALMMAGYWCLDRLQARQLGAVSRRRCAGEPSPVEDRLPAFERGCQVAGSGAWLGTWHAAVPGAGRARLWRRGRLSAVLSETGVSAARRQRERSLDRRKQDRGRGGLVDGLRWVLGEHGDDVAVPGLGGGQVGQGQDSWLGSALEPGCLPLGRVEQQAAVVERERLADRGQARPAGEGGQGGVGAADVVSRGEPFEAVDVARRGPRCRRRGGKGCRVDGAGQQRSPAVPAPVLGWR